MSPFKLLIPTLFDVIASTLGFVALVQCTASVYQMMRGMIVVITAIMSVVFLKKKQYFHHKISLTLIVIGVTIVGMVGVGEEASHDHTEIE